MTYFIKGLSNFLINHIFFKKFDNFRDLIGIIEKRKFVSSRFQKRYSFLTARCRSEINMKKVWSCFLVNQERLKKRPMIHRQNISDKF